MTFIEPNTDEGCRIFHRVNGNVSQDFFGLSLSLSAVRFFMIKSSNYLTIKPVVTLSSMPYH